MPTAQPEADIGGIEIPQCSSLPAWCHASWTNCVYGGDCTQRPRPRTLDLGLSHGDRGRDYVLCAACAVGAHASLQQPSPDQELGDRCFTLCRPVSDRPGLSAFLPA